MGSEKRQRLQPSSPQRSCPLRDTNGATCAVLQDHALASTLLSMVSHKTLRALRWSCRRWSSIAYYLGPDSSRALAKLSIWPSALRDDIADSVGGARRTHEEKMQERRARLLEALRMSCQDPQIASDESLTDAQRQRGDDGGDGGSGADVACARTGHVDWFRDESFRDTGITDMELQSALFRAEPGDVRRIVLCSARLTDQGVLRALRGGGGSLDCKDAFDLSRWKELIDLCVVAFPTGRCTGRSTPKHAEFKGHKPPAPALSTLGADDGHQTLVVLPEFGARGRRPEEASHQRCFLAQVASRDATAAEETASTNSSLTILANQNSPTSNVEKVGVSDLAESKNRLCLTGAVLAPLVQCGRQGVKPALRQLVLIGVQSVPLRGIIDACDLRTLMLHGSLSTTCVESISRCRNLRTLKLSIEPRTSWAPFIRVFTECRQLRDVDIYSATNVSDQILGCVMLHLGLLETFSSSCVGSLMDATHVLSTRFIDAFRAHFSSARKIVIDNIVTNSVL
eukprot:TRINITY_DN13577_c0_g1_i1.p1 TRINITY_DN13577_c0_g1~~TRINITY_DN13577_c0_g1_i1.p1  ORF type:complete len:512 (+),score=58.64 TRINITY_DN13577_c0_g1_i1:191-1726(+)